MGVCFQVSHQNDIIGKGRTNDIVQVRIILGRIEKFTAQAFRLSVNGIAAAISDGFFYFLNDFLRGRDTLNIQQLDDYVCEHTFEDLRVTLINKNGTVIYDNLEKDPSHFENHHNRQEIKEAITYGSGCRF